MQIKMKVGLLSAIISFLFSLPSAKSMGSLVDVTKPYQGIYTCKELVYGEKDMREYLQDFTLELKSNGEMLFTCKDTLGTIQKRTGKYRYDAKSGVLTLIFVNGDKEINKDVSLKNGQINFTTLVGGKIFSATFEQE